MPKNDWGNREQTDICRGNKGTISLLSGNREHCKRLRKIKFLHRKPGLSFDFCDPRHFAMSFAFNTFSCLTI